MPNLRIILTEPQEAGNVGAAARVMKNFGFADLWIAGSHPQLLPVAGWWASGADDLLAAVTERPSLHEALAGAHVTVATTSSRGRTSPVDFDPESLADFFASMPGEQTLALVFGREDSGLTREELMLCQRTATIPTNPAFPTMNLAQSVGMFCYALSRITPSPVERARPPAELVERLHERSEALLLEAGFLHGNNPDRIYDDLRNMAGRADLDSREVTILLGVVRQLEWRMKR
jgi:tRNA/rRNA methyltransferase